MAAIFGFYQSGPKHFPIVNRDRDSFYDEFLSTAGHFPQFLMDFRFNEAVFRNRDVPVAYTIFVSIFWLIEIVAAIFIYDETIILKDFMRPSSYSHTHIEVPLLQ